MAMKQTQTKLFDFSDVGLDFCAGSKNLFPDRFKKMLSLGYNVQTVTSVAVAGNQVTFTYGGTHGYAADRVLKVDSGALASINGGEFWIDSVTTNTVTFTLDDAPISVAGGFTTRIAPLGWDLVYELNHIHIYKFKHIDDTEMYARLCFQNTATHRNCVAVGLGKNAELATGVIVDDDCFVDLTNCSTPANATSNNRWEFSIYANSTHNNYTYTQGQSSFGKGQVVGSAYHIAILSHASNSIWTPAIQGIFPFTTVFEVIDKPVLACFNFGVGPATQINTNGLFTSFKLFVGKREVTGANSGPSNNNFRLEQAGVHTLGSLLPSDIDGFNTTTAKPLDIFTLNDRQLIGYCDGVYQILYGTSNKPDLNINQMPLQTLDIDLSHQILLHAVAFTGGTQSWLAFPVEELKYD